MTTYDFDRAQDFIWRNARLLERRLFIHLYQNGPREPVIAALKAYQNPDGGFGNALEPDKRDPHSQPVDLERALQILDMIGALQDTVVKDLLLPACDWLVSVTTPEGGVPYAMPTANGYPHAPWWTMPENPPANLNPTADIVGLLMKAGIDHPWLNGAVDFCWNALATADMDQLHFHDLMPVISFLENSPDRVRAEKELERVAKRILAPGEVEYNPQAGGYVKMPLDWAPSPRSFCRRLFDDATIAHHLQALASHQHADGGWAISWDPISAGVEIEWRGIITLDALNTLKAYEQAGIGLPE
jgi:hypothetical protein